MMNLTQKEKDRTLNLSRSQHYLRTAAAAPSQFPTYEALHNLLGDVVSSLSVSVSAC